MHSTSFVQQQFTFQSHVHQDEHVGSFEGHSVVFYVRVQLQRRILTKFPQYIWVTFPVVAVQDNL